MVAPLIPIAFGFLARTLGINAIRAGATRVAGAGVTRAAGAGATGQRAASAQRAAARASRRQSGKAGAGGKAGSAAATAGGAGKGAAIGSLVSNLFDGEDGEKGLGEKIVRSGKDALVQRVKQSKIMRSKPVEAISVLYSYSKKLKDTLKQADDENEEVIRNSLPPAIPPLVPDISESQDSSGFKQYALREKEVIEVVRENEEKRVRNDSLNRKKNPVRTLINGLMSSVSLLQDESKDSIDEQKRYEFALKNQQEEEIIEGEKQQKVITEVKNKGVEKVKEYADSATDLVKLFLLQFAPAAGLLATGGVFGAAGLIQKGLSGLKDFLVPDFLEETIEKAKNVDDVLREQSEQGKQAILGLPGRILGFFKGDNEEQPVQSQNDYDESLVRYQEASQEVTNIDKQIAELGTPVKIGEEEIRDGNGLPTGETATIMGFEDPEKQAKYESLQAQRDEVRSRKRQAARDYAKARDDVDETRKFGLTEEITGLRGIDRDNASLRDKVEKVIALKNRGYSDEQLGRNDNLASNYIGVGDARYPLRVLGLYEEVVQRELDQYSTEVAQDAQETPTEESRPEVTRRRRRPVEKNIILRDMAERMGLDTSQPLQGKFVGGVPVEINGQIVPEELYTEEERRNVNAARQISAAMGNQQQAQVQESSDSQNNSSSIISEQILSKAIIPQVDRVSGDINILNQSLEHSQKQRSYEPGSQGPSTPTSAFPTIRTTDSFVDSSFIT